MAHVERYLKDSDANEQDKTWSTQMLALIKEMLHYGNGLDSSEELLQKKNTSTNNQVIIIKTVSIIIKEWLNI